MKLHFIIDRMSPDLLPAIAAFSRVAHHGSFTRAAAELGVSASALSQSVRALEERLQVRLLNRTTRRVGLTELGAEFLRTAQGGLDAITAAAQQLEESREQPTGVLRITLSRASAAIVLTPHLAAFHAEFPGVRLDLSLDDGFIDLVAGGFDAGIRLGENLAQDMVAVRISADQRSVTVGAPAYFERHPPPRTPADLHHHACLNMRFVSSGAIYRWEYAERGRPFEIEVQGPLVSNDLDTMLHAARQGLGLAHVLEGNVRDDLDSGRLLPVLQKWWLTFPGFYLYYPHRANMPRKLRVLVDFLQRQLRAPAPAVSRASAPRSRPRPPARRA